MKYIALQKAQFAYRVKTLTPINLLGSARAFSFLISTSFGSCFMVSTTFGFWWAIFLPWLFYPVDPSISQRWSLPPRVTCRRRQSNISRYALPIQPQSSVTLGSPPSREDDYYIGRWSKEWHQVSLSRWLYASSRGRGREQTTENTSRVTPQVTWSAPRLRSPWWCTLRWHWAGGTGSRSLCKGLQCPLGCSQGKIWESPWLPLLQWRRDI